MNMPGIFHFQRFLLSCGKRCNRYPLKNPNKLRPFVTQRVALIRCLILIFPKSVCSGLDNRGQHNSKRYAQSLIQPEEQLTEQVREQIAGEVRGEVTGEVKGEVARLLLVIQGDMKRSAMLEALELKGEDSFYQQSSRSWEREI